MKINPREPGRTKCDSTFVIRKLLEAIPSGAL